MSTTLTRSFKFSCSPSASYTFTPQPVSLISPFTMQRPPIEPRPRFRPQISPLWRRPVPHIHQLLSPTKPNLRPPPLQAPLWCALPLFHHHSNTHQQSHTSTPPALPPCTNSRIECRVLSPAYPVRGPTARWPRTCSRTAWMVRCCDGRPSYTRLHVCDEAVEFRV
jgi:hypothetical protein